MENEATAKWIAQQSEAGVFPSQINDVRFGERVVVRPFCNLYGCAIGDDTRIGAYTEIGKGVVVGKGCKIGAYVFIPPGVTIGDHVFIGPRVTFTNDKYPSAVVEDWTLLHTRVEDRASLGAGVVVLPGLTIGHDALIGAGTIITADVAPGWKMHGYAGLSGVPPESWLRDAERGTGK